MVIRAVNVHVESEVEEVLMVYRLDTRRDLVAMTFAVVRRVILGLIDAARRHDAGQHHFHFEHAVLMKDPVEAILIIADIGKP